MEIGRYSKFIEIVSYSLQYIIDGMVIQPQQSAKQFSTEAKKWHTGLIKDIWPGLNVNVGVNKKSHTHSQDATAPLFEITLHLNESKVVFSPSLEESSNGTNFQSILYSLINDILETSTYIPRIIDESLLSEYKTHKYSIKVIDTLEEELKQQRQEGEFPIKYTRYLR